MSALYSFCDKAVIAAETVNSRIELISIFMVVKLI